jgi:hypothetical protein
VLPALGQKFQPAYSNKKLTSKNLLSVSVFQPLITKHCPRNTLVNLRAGNLLLFEEVAKLFPALFLLKRLQISQISPADGFFDNPLGVVRQKFRPARSIVHQADLAILRPNFYIRFMSRQFCTIIHQSRVSQQFFPFSFR